MRTIYIDSEFRCHLNSDGTYRAIETDYFDGKCDEYVEGYRFVPDSEEWVRDDGTIFRGEMIAPYKDFNLLLVAQQKYEMADAENALAILLGGETV